MVDLDSPQRFQSLDPSDMLGRIGDWETQIEQAWRLASSIELPARLRAARSIVVLGMGGSAIGGDLARSLVQRTAGVPMSVCRDYDVPAFVDKHTLAIASSHSGNTEETLSATAQALERGAMLVAITTGGRLAQLASEHQFPLVRFSYPAQPRAALGFSLFLLLGVLERGGVVPAGSLDPEDARQAVRDTLQQYGAEVATARNRAKQLALSLQGKLALVYGGGILSEVARRWKGQINENSKQWSFFEQLPELNHNAVVGYQFPRELLGDILVILLHSTLTHPRIQVREQVTRELLTRSGIACEVLEASGKSELGQMISSIVQGDLVSYYLALLNGVDPSTIEAIDYLKARLAEA